MAKPTFEEMWNTEFFQQHARNAIERVLSEHESMLINRFEYVVKQCESPLEAAFAAWWESVLYLGMADLGLLYQQEVEAGGKKYRLDLVVVPCSPGFYGQTSRELRPKIAIELDGHDFHEKTKEQVTLRNQRDRDLASAGWQVWHVSGSEFHRAPYDTVRGEYLRAISSYAKAFPIQLK